MKLDVSATRHPSVASRLLISVQDQDGPVGNLTDADFEVFVWSPPPPNAFDRFFLPVARADELKRGFYALSLGTNVVGHGDDTAELAAEDLRAVVFGVTASRAEDRGNAIAVTPLRGEVP